jgi:uncharacterized protein (DUF1778 family)
VPSSCGEEWLGLPTVSPSSASLQLLIPFGITAYMTGRTALLINCSVQEASEIRARAELQRRTVSGYVLNIAMRSVGYDEQLFTRFERLSSFGGRWRRRFPIEKPRTTMHLHCSKEEATRIRDSAKRRDTTISGFILHCLHRSWELSDGLPTKTGRFS